MENILAVLSVLNLALAGSALLIIIYVAVTTKHTLDILEFLDTEDENNLEEEAAKVRKRRRSLSKVEIEELKELFQQAGGPTPYELAEKYDVSTSTIYRYTKDL